MFIYIYVDIFECQIGKFIVKNRHILLFTADMLILRLRVNYRPGAQFYGEQKWEARKFRAPGQAQVRKVRAARACAPKNDRPVC